MPSIKRNQSSSPSSGGTSKKPPDKRELRSKMTKAKIQLAAGNLFASNDFNSITVDNIVAAAGVSKATFYVHFSRKEDLILEYAERRLRHAAGLLPGLLMRPSALEAISEMVSIVLKERDWQPELVRIILLELETSYHRLHTHDLRQLLLPIIEVGAGRGEIRTDLPPSTLASFVADAIYNALRNWGMECTGEALDPELDNAVTLAFDAIRKR